MSYSDPVRCPTSRLKRGFVLKTLKVPERKLVRAHLRICKSCREEVAAMHAPIKEHRKQQSHRRLPRSDNPN